VITNVDIISNAVCGRGRGASNAAASVVGIPTIVGYDDEGYGIGFAPGTYYIGAIADSTNAVLESETNNALPGNQITIQ
jgi:hypothetical protein